MNRAVVKTDEFNASYESSSLLLKNVFSVSIDVDVAFIYAIDTSKITYYIIVNKKSLRIPRREEIYNLSRQISLEILKGEILISEFYLDISFLAVNASVELDNPDQYMPFPFSVTYKQLILE